jgi:hypothetical protein
MKNLKLEETRIFCDSDENELMSCGVGSLKLTLNTTIKSSKANINIVENRIRIFCFDNDVKIIHLYQTKAKWLIRNLHIQLEGDIDDIDAIKNYLEKISKYYHVDI